MMPNERAAGPERTAVRVALWRAMHLLVDPPPHVLDDALGLQLAAPDGDWRRRPDMNVRATARARATVIARARFAEDLVAEAAARGVDQYVVLGAGLDTFAQRRPEMAASFRVFEVDQPVPQEWKRARLSALGLGLPAWLRFVPVDFEAGESWREGLVAAGFDATRPAVVASLGVSMYLSREATAATLREAAALAPGSTLVMTFQLPLALIEPEEHRSRQQTERGARAGGTPWLSYFTPEEMVALAREAGFHEVRHVAAADLARRYFAGREDGLRPSSMEDVLVAVA